MLLSQVNIYMTTLMGGSMMRREGSLVCRRVVFQKYFLVDSIVFFRANVEFTIEKGRVYTYFRNPSRALWQQQWYKSQQHQLYQERNFNKSKSYRKIKKAQFISNTTTLHDFTTGLFDIPSFIFSNEVKSAFLLVFFNHWNTKEHKN